MTLTLTWGGVALPAPEAFDGITVAHTPLAAGAVKLGGATRIDYMGVKRTVTLRFIGLAASEMTALGGTGLRDLYLANLGTAPQLVLPNGETFNATVIESNFREVVDYYEDGQTALYHVDMTLEEE